MLLLCSDFGRAGDRAGVGEGSLGAGCVDRARSADHPQRSDRQLYLQRQSLQTLKEKRDNPADVAYTLMLIPSLIAIWFSYMGWLPFTKKAVMEPKANLEAAH